MCMPYTSRDEITTAIQSTMRMCQDDELRPEFVPPPCSTTCCSLTFHLRDISEYEIDSQMMTTLRGSPPLDILIRTSGVKRLSDFLLWQVCQLDVFLFDIRSDPLLVRHARTHKFTLPMHIGPNSACVTSSLSFCHISKKYGPHGVN